MLTNIKGVESWSGRKNMRRICLWWCGGCGKIYFVTIYGWGGCWNFRTGGEKGNP